MKELVEDLKIANDNLYSANKMLEKEIERLNNIINELEEDIKLELSKIREQNDYNIGLHNAFAHIKFKLQELKGEDKEWIQYKKN